MKKETLQLLLEKLKNGTLTPGERRQLDEWDSSLDREKSLLDLYTEHEQAAAHARMWEQVTRQTTPTGRLIYLPSSSPPGLKGRRKSDWLKYAAAIVILIGAIGYFLRSTVIKQEQLANAVANTTAKDFAAPTTSRATLTLSNGQQVILDSVSHGMLAIEGDINIQKTPDGRIVYSGAGNGQTQYNTLRVPRGSKIASIVLADGTRVFLNAASSLTYPVAFGDTDRKVEVSGEAYFEVAKDKRRKFIVSSSNLITEVLGTHFNVNTYADEGVQKITLLEGSVKVTGGSSAIMIKPGEQVAYASGRIHVDHAVDLEQVMAWKNGVFNFNNASCEAVMRQLSRWYNIDVVYPRGIPDIQFGGEIQQTLSLAEMLEALGQVEVKFEINDNQLVVLP